MSKRPWYKRYGGDFIQGTLHMTLEEKGAYSVILDLIYDRGAPIPDDPQWIARACGCSTRKWNQLRARLIELGKITASDGLIDNARAKKQRFSEEIEHDKLAENGSKGAEKKRQNGQLSLINNDLEEKGLHEPQKPNQKPDTRSQKEEPPPNGGGRARGTRLPEGSEFPDEWRQWAIAEGCAEPERIWPKFHDYWIAQPGQRGVKRDWFATWRNWVRKEIERAPQPGHPANQPGRGGPNWDNVDRLMNQRLRERSR